MSSKKGLNEIACPEKTKIDMKKAIKMYVEHFLSLAIIECVI